MTINWILFKKMTLLFIFISVISFLVSCFLKPTANDFLNLAHSNNELGITSNTARKFMFYIIHNGIKIPFQMFLLSLIPIPLLYFLNLFLTAIATGVVFYIPLMSDLNGKLSILDIGLGTFSHMFIEIAGFLIVACELYYVNKSVRNKLFKRTENNMAFSDSIKQLSIIYLFVALPLLVMAAFIEAFLTPILI